MLKTRNYHFGRRIRALCVIMKKTLSCVAFAAVLLFSS